MTALISVGLMLLLLGVAAITAATARNISDGIRSDFGFVVIMDRDCSQESVMAMKTLLLRSDYVERFTFTSKDDILEQESQEMGQDISSLIEINPYASEFNVKVKPAYSNADSIAVFTQFVELSPEVSEIIVESDIIKDVDMALERIRNVLLIVVFVLFLISVVLINNTVSLSIYSRRFIIHTMRLVGATANFIRWPFVKAGCINGFISATIAILVLSGIRLYLPCVDPVFAIYLPWVHMAVLFIIIIILGVALCAFTAAFAASRHLRATYDEMFLK